MMGFLDDIPEVLVHLIDSDLPPLQKCFSFIREGILLGYLKKGQHIVERELVDLLQVSRTPVREAIRQLEKENLVAHYPYRGCVVVGFSAKDIMEMYELRILLECFLMRKIVEFVDVSALQMLKQKVQEEHDGDKAAGEEYSKNFHMRLLALVRHRWLSQFLGQLEEYIARFHVLSFLRQGRKEDAFLEHLSILDALIAKDAETSAQLMTKHLEASLKAFLAAAPLM
jgi:DNA-binding GntR family transcriptional regulator